MCGIIGYLGSSDSKKVLLEGLTHLEYRGYDSAGIAIREKDRVDVFRVEGRIKSLEEKLASKQFSGTVGIGHTRWATHGAPSELNAHPHRVGAITLVHNGIIENYSEHKDTLVGMGRKISSETDSEIAAHLFDLEAQAGRKLEEAIPRVMSQLRGSYAFVIMSDFEPDILAGVRNGAPLLIGVGEKEHFLASDIQAVLHRTNQIIFLQDGQFALCKRDKVTIKTAEGDRVQPDISSIDWTSEQMDKLGYPHYMLKEIFEQSQAAANTIDGNIDHRDGIVSIRELGSLLTLLPKLKRLCIVACGTARHAGIVGKYYVERLAQMPVEVDFGSEFRYRDPILDQETLLILISQSGETADTLAALREGKRKGVPTLSICNVRGSTLSRESDVVLHTNAGPEIGVASTKAFTTQLVVLYMLAIQLGKLRGTLKKDKAVEFTRELLHLPLLIERVLGTEPEIEAIARKYYSRPFFFYMGRGIYYPIALEGALKLKEISYIHAEGYPSGELKHGPIALVDTDTVTVSIAPRASNGVVDTLFEKQISNLLEVKARKGSIVSIGTEGDLRLREYSDQLISIPRTSWGLSPILATMPVQLLAYHIAVLRQTDVDKPRNLAKSVTVE
ncbi:MAG: glutamine--fructose-6-phosphate transaminase (isomerizing) [Deltaproteobacteria bacterium]|nr:glutamine--fructose-6-phosphate transaminase (isomerizing) [Deltaproteobacteria bacterium]